MELQFILNHFTLIVAVVCAMCVMVSVITEFTKEFGFLNVIPTKLQVLVTSLIVCIIAFMMYMSYMKLQIFWYYIPAVIFVAIIVAIITTNGWEYFLGSLIGSLLRTCLIIKLTQRKVGKYYGSTQQTRC